MLKNENIKEGYRYFFLRYSVLFLLMAVLIFLPFMLSGKLLIDEGDGFNQHYSSALYLSKSTRSTVRTLFTTGNLSIQTWDNTIGLGQDTLQSLNYYGLGDPLELVYALFPVKTIAYVFCFMTILRMYLAGVALKLFASKFQINSDGIIVGALLYAFCAFSISYGVIHPLFLNSMIYLPLILLGAENIFQKKRPILFIGMIALGGISNFVFLFSNSLFMLLFCIVRFLSLHKKGTPFWKDFAVTALKFLAYFCLGILTASCVLLPVLYGLFASARSDTSFQGNLFFYEVSTYVNMCKVLYSDAIATQTTNIGLSVLGVFSAILVFTLRTKKANYLKVIIAATALGLLTPFTSYILNGTIHPKNRWSFVFALVLSCAVAYVFDAFKKLTMEQKVALTVSACITGFVTMFATIINTGFAEEILLPAKITLGILTIAIALLWMKRLAHKLPYLLSVLCLAQVAFMGYAHFAPEFYGNLDRYIKADKTAETFNARAPHLILKKIDPNTGDYRYHAYPYQGRNYGLRTEMPGMSASLSLQPSRIFTFSHLVGNAEVSNNSFFESFDNRAVLTTLSNTKYLVQDKKPNQFVPYGFLPIKETQNYTIFKNNFALHKIYTYSRQLDNRAWTNLSPTDKEQALLEGVLLETPDGKPVSLLPKITYHSSKQTILTHSEIINLLKKASKEEDAGRHIVISHNKIVVKRNQQSLTIPVRGIANAENYLQISNLDFERFEPSRPSLSKEIKHRQIDISRMLIAGYYKDTSVTSEQKNRFTIREKTSDYWIGPLTRAVNLGYNKQPLSYIKIYFQNEGTYTFSNLELLTQPMEKYPEKIARLSDAKISDLKIKENTISATLDAPSERVAVLAVPYSSGWKVSVNGSETPTYVANGLYIGFKVKAGENHIMCSYSTPGLKLGLIISLSTLLCLCGVILYKKNAK